MICDVAVLRRKRLPPLSRTRVDQRRKGVPVRLKRFLGSDFLHSRRRLGLRLTHSSLAAASSVLLPLRHLHISAATAPECSMSCLISFSWKNGSERCLRGRIASGRSSSETQVEDSSLFLFHFHLFSTSCRFRLILGRQERRKIVFYF